MDKATVKYYMSEACPFFAIALHKLTGFQLAMLVDEANYERWGRKEYPTVAHVFVLTPKGTAIDVKGERPLGAVKDDFYDLVDPRVLEVSVDDLKKYMGDNRPLCRYDAKEIAEAKRLIETA